MTEDLFPHRVSYAIEQGGGVKAVSEKTGLSASVLRKWISGESDPSRERLVVLARAAGVSVGWLATGEIHQENSGESANRGDYHASDQAHLYARIPIYNIEAAADHGQGLIDEDIHAHISFPKTWLRRFTGVIAEAAALITAIDDTMEPTIRRGDLVMIDRNSDNVQKDSIYLIHANGLLKLKRLQLSPTGHLTVRSDNLVYPEDILQPNQLDVISILGRVCMITKPA